MSHSITFSPTKKKSFTNGKIFMFCNNLVANMAVMKTARYWYDISFLQIFIVVVIEPFPLQCYAEANVFQVLGCVHCAVMAAPADPVLKNIIRFICPPVGTNKNKITNTHKKSI